FLDCRGSPPVEQAKKFKLTGCPRKREREAAQLAAERRYETDVPTSMRQRMPSREAVMAAADRAGPRGGLKSASDRRWRCAQFSGHAVVTGASSRYGRGPNTAHHFGGIDRPPSRVTFVAHTACRRPRRCRFRTRRISRTRVAPRGLFCREGMKTTAIDVLT